MITKVYVSFDIEQLKKISDRDLMDYMKKIIAETIKKEIDKTKIQINIDEYRSKAGLIFAYTTFELNLEVKKNENS